MNIKRLITDFPIFENIPGFIYFDNAATTQKPMQVIQRINQFYSKENAPVKRGIYKLAEEATEFYESARKVVANFIAADYNEIIFTSNATESINFIASTWAENHLKEGDEIVLTELEHHSNLLPWQHLARKKKLILKFIPITQDGMLDLTHLNQIITNKTKLVTFLDVSNAIGTHVDVHSIVKRAREIGAKILIDACQSVPHQKIDVKKYDCDFLVFSGHKLLGPTGIGVLYISQKIQSEVPPYQYGGGMVFQVEHDKIKLLESPYCYEAGTPPIAQAIALGSAIKFLENNVNFDELKYHESQLCTRLIEGLESLPGYKILGPISQLKRQGHLVSFIHETIHFHDIAAYLDQYSICVRAGHYCAQPLARKLDTHGSVRVSFYLYNTLEQVDYLIQCLKSLKL